MSYTDLTFTLLEHVALLLFVVWAARQYLDPFANLLFFAAWPMLAACFALYYLRDLDTLWTVAG